MNDQKINPKDATVIDQRAMIAAAEGRDKIEAEKEARAAQEAARKWERVTKRTFKGIYSRGQRLVLAKIALAKLEREIEAREHE